MDQSDGKPLGAQPSEAAGSGSLDNQEWWGEGTLRLERGCQGTPSGQTG